MTRLSLVTLLIVVGLVLVACAQQAPAATPIPPTATPVPTVAVATKAPTTAPPPTAEPVAEGDPSLGEAAWAEVGCANCHGATGTEGFAPKLAGTSMSYGGFQDVVRQGRNSMPGFSSGKLSDINLRNIYAWLASLAN